MARKWLSFAVDRLLYPKPSEVFPNATCKRDAFSFIPEDTIINFYIEKDCLYCTLNIISICNPNSAAGGPNRNRSVGSHSSSLAVPNGQSINGKKYIFFNGAPTEILYNLKLYAELPNLMQTRKDLQMVTLALGDILGKLNFAAAQC